jgi:LPS sulfotransferase NodH
LCEALTATGVAGRPSEVFAPDFRGPWFDFWGLAPDCGFQAYFDAATAHGTGQNGNFGLKIQWMHVPVLAKDLRYRGPASGILSHLYPGARYVNTVRRDRRAQALSWYRAIVTNQWFSMRDDAATAEPLAPTLSGILELEREIDRQQTGWETFFDAHGIRPHTIQYEELDSNYHETLAQALAFLELDPKIAQSLGRPRLRRQADVTTLRWRTMIDQLEADAASNFHAA